MTKSEILREAHKMTRDERRRFARRGEAFCYRAIFAECLQAAYANAKKPDSGYGFQIIEPWYRRQMFVTQRPAGWVTL